MMETVRGPQHRLSTAPGSHRGGTSVPAHWPKHIHIHIFIAINNISVYIYIYTYVYVYVYIYIYIYIYGNPTG